MVADTETLVSRLRQLVTCGIWARLGADWDDPPSTPGSRYFGVRFLVNAIIKILKSLFMFMFGKGVKKHH